MKAELVKILNMELSVAEAVWLRKYLQRLQAEWGSCPDKTTAICDKLTNVCVDGNVRVSLSEMETNWLHACVQNTFIPCEEPYDNLMRTLLFGATTC